MKAVKRSLADFICAFVIFAILLVGIALVTGEDFAQNAVMWKEESKTLSLFGTEISFDTEFADVPVTLLKFNDSIFGKGFSKGLLSSFEFVRGYIGDFLNLSYGMARRAVGAA